LQAHDSTSAVVSCYSGKQAWVHVLFQKLVINDRGKVVDRLLNHPFDEIRIQERAFE
jgi:hypothetical protein